MDHNTKQTETDIPKIAFMKNGILNVIHEKSSGIRKWLYLKKIEKDEGMNDEQYIYTCRYIMKLIKTTPGYDPNILKTNRKVYCTYDEVYD